MQIFTLGSWSAIIIKATSWYHLGDRVSFKKKKGGKIHLLHNVMDEISTKKIIEKMKHYDFFISFTLKAFFSFSFIDFIILLP